MNHWILERNSRLDSEEIERELATTRETGDLVATFDPDGFLLSLNQAGYRLLELATDATLQQYRLYDFYAPDSRNRFLEQDVPAAVAGHVWHSERTLLSTSGTAIPCSQILVAHPTPDDGVQFFSLIAHDISVIKQAESERNVLREQLFQARKMETMGKLAGGIAHDFNNFLTVIIGYAELGMLNTENRANPQAELRIILDTAQKAARLTAQLLDYSSKKMIEPQILDLNQVITEARQLLASMMGETIHVHYQLEPQLWPIRFDRAQLEQILFNLAVNARDAMEGTGTFVLSTGNSAASAQVLPTYSMLAGNDCVALRISDNGSGMDDKLLEQIFEPFFTTKERGKGTGLGLSAVFGAVKQNCSEIRVESEPGKGSTFEVLIPAYRQAVPATPRATMQPAGDGLGKGRETILLAEDNQEVRTLLSQMLETLGYEVITACDGVEGEALFISQAERIALMISDIVMPGMNGVELAHLCLKLKPDLKVLLISGHNDEIVYFRGKRQPHLRMLNKPFSPQRLAAEVRALLESDAAAPTPE